MIAFMLKQPLLTSALLLVALAVSIVIAAFGFEHIGGFQPCPLCLIERKSWYFAVPAGLLTLVALKIDRQGFAKLLLLVIGIMFIANVGLAGYHAGVEWKWWAGPSSCSGNHLTPLGGPGGLLEAISKTKVVRCDIAQFRLFGLSFAGYNVLLSLLAAFIAAYGIFFQARRLSAED